MGVLSRDGKEAGAVYRLCLDLSAMITGILTFFSLIIGFVLTVIGGVICLAIPILLFLGALGFFLLHSTGKQIR